MFHYFKNVAMNIFYDLLEPKPILSDYPCIKIGDSVENRPIYSFEFGNGKTKILFGAGIHGNEIGSIKLAFKIITWLKNNHSSFPTCTFFVIPCINPDGYWRAQENPDYRHGGRVGRFNARMVDLNRNFDTRSFQKKSLWSFGKDYSQTTEVFCGDHGNSEPEIQALTRFIKGNGITIFYSFHNAGRDVIGATDILSQKLAELFSRASDFKLLSDEAWRKLSQTGTAKEWCECNKTSFLEVEGSTRCGSDWNIQKDAILRTVSEASLGSHFAP